MDWLVNIEYIDFIVPTPWIETRAVGVDVDDAGTTFAVHTIKGCFSGTTGEVKCKGCAGWILACGEVPVECADVKGFACYRGRKIDVAGIGIDAGRCFANVGLGNDIS